VAPTAPAIDFGERTMPIDQQFSFQKVTIYTDRNRDLTGSKIAIANQCWTGVISAIQSL
jgi:hypothetical protein